MNVPSTGNYYSLRSQHEKAVLYFQRVLKLNPNYLSAWTLMGHEYMELKNTPAAIQAYRHAIGGLCTGMPLVGCVEAYRHIIVWLCQHSIAQLYAVA